MDESSFWLGFSVFPGIGPKRFQQLLTYFGSASVAWNASKKELHDAQLGEVLIDKFLAFRKTFNGELYYQKLEKSDVTFVTLLDENYPALLKTINSPPFVLYYKGSVMVNELENSFTIGIVGTRKITSYGRQVTAQLTEDLVRAGSVIVSGLAMGVDAVAHQTTLDSSGKTIAVLGCGVDCCNPRSNQRLYEDIVASGGAVVSEFSLSQAPSIGSFPSRNRIIAGLSQAVLVTEGAADSGALITAQDALENNRPVFAVPGPITSSLSQGPNKLLRQGATLVTNAEDILAALGVHTTGSVSTTTRSVPHGETEDEEKIIILLCNESLHFDEIGKKTGFSPAKLSVILSLLEMKGIVSQNEKGYMIL
jgi:DNA processing protein